MWAIKYPDKGGVSVKIVKYRSEFLCLSFGKTLKTREDGVSKLVAITRRGKKPLGTYWPERPTNYTQDRSSQTVRLPRTLPHKSDQVQGHEKNNSKRKTPIASSNYWSCSKFLIWLQLPQEETRWTPWIINFWRNKSVRDLKPTYSSLHADYQEESMGTKTQSKNIIQHSFGCLPCRRLPFVCGAYKVGIGIVPASLFGWRQEIRMANLQKKSFLKKIFSVFEFPEQKGSAWRTLNEGNSGKSFCSCNGEISAPFLGHY